MWSDVGAVTGTLAGDSSNVVDLIKNKYEVGFIVQTSVINNIVGQEYMVMGR